MKIKYFSLFNGIGGFSLGIDKVFPDAECVGFSEIYEPANNVHLKHYPSHVNFGDVAKIVWKHDKLGEMLEDKRGKPILNTKALDALPYFDMLVGGSPCQGLSSANITRRHLADERSRLFYAYLQILRYKKPKYFLLENVASMSKDARNIISKLLGVEPIEINSSLVSAQNRKRLYWCNWDVSQPKERGILFQKVLEKKPDDQYDLSGKQLHFIQNVIQGKETHWNFDNGYTPIQIRQADPVLLAYSRSIREVKNNGKQVGSYDEKRIRVDGIANTLVTGSGCGGSHSKNFVKVGERIRNLTPIECARLQTFPDNWHKGILSDSQAYKVYGNAVTVDVIAHIVSCLPISTVKKTVKRKAKLIKRC